MNSLKGWGVGCAWTSGGRRWQSTGQTDSNSDPRAVKRSRVEHVHKYSFGSNKPQISELTKLLFVDIERHLCDFNDLNHIFISWTSMTAQKAKNPRLCGAWVLRGVV
jgi:hypothetical protein